MQRQQARREPSPSLDFCFLILFHIKATTNIEKISKREEPIA
jgi:hypothetical protein